MRVFNTREEYLEAKVQLYELREAIELYEKSIPVTKAQVEFPNGFIRDYTEHMASIERSKWMHD